MSLRSHRGNQAERQALRFLQDFGLKLLDRNYRAPGGEIDLILQDGRVIVFVEVRSRSNNNYMDTLESISREKVARIIRTGEQYLQTHGITDRTECRFDVITLTGNIKSPKIEWYKDAFQA